MLHRLCISLLLLTTALIASAAASNPESYAAILNWKSSPPSFQNQCGGYYVESDDIRAHPNPLPIGDMPINITSTGKAVYSLNSNSVLEGNVILTQTGREIRADKAILIPDSSTGKIDHIHLEGHIRYQESGRLVTGKTAEIDLNQKTLTLHQTVYHLVQPTKTGTGDTWGTAVEAHRESPTLSWFKQATFSTCPPDQSPAWHLKAKHLNLDKAKGRGTAKSVVLYAKNTPIFYLPYLSFPIDKRRYSGFLYPTFGYENHSGAFFSLPYYFNLAPNYDDTLTIMPMTQRGILFSNEFRYLTTQHSGLLDLNILPNDRGFSNFRTTQQQMYGGNPIYLPYLNALNRDSDTRTAIRFQENANFNSNWSGSANINRVSDDYYFQDISNNLSALNTNQLLNQATVVYSQEQWQFSSRLEAWQTLHPINQLFNLDQYSRLPDLSFSGFWPDKLGGVTYNLDSEWVYFDHANDFFTGMPYPTGNRFHLAPGISLPLQAAYGFLTPSLTLDNTLYSVHNNAVVNMNTSPPTLIPDNDPSLNKIRALPLFNIDSGLYFDKNFEFLSHDYKQTLEPRLFYLYVPATDQNDIPIFDTQLLPFNFDELFRNNRFMGYDRIGDANQVSVGLTSRLLDGYTGEEKANFGIGAIYYLRQHTVCLYPDCSDDPTIQDRISPVASQLTYRINPRFSVIGNAAWDPNQHQMNNNSLRFQYAPGEGRVVNLGYDYIKRGDILDPTNLDNNQNNLHRIDMSFSWPLPKTTHWNALGDLTYNISHEHPQNFLYGLEYESCCWAIRLASTRLLQAEDLQGNIAYRKAYYVQFLLKGLGSIGNSGDGAVLASSIPGYSDPFK